MPPLSPPLAGSAGVIRRWGPVARTELPEKIGLSSGSITQLTAGLLERGLVVERKETGKRPGRPRQYLEINSHGGIVVGASLGGRGRVDVAYIDLMGNLLHKQDFRLGQQPTLAAMASAIAEGLAQAIGTSPFANGLVSRVGKATRRRCFRANMPRKSANCWKIAA